MRVCVTAAGDGSGRRPGACFCRLSRRLFFSSLVSAVRFADKPGRDNGVGLESGGCVLGVEDVMCEMEEKKRVLFWGVTIVEAGEKSIVPDAKAL